MTRNDEDTPVLDLSLAELLRLLPAILVALTVHELAHAFAALRLGDPTPQLLGRVTLNPLRHIDPVGFLMLVIAGFGWARPVVINRDNLKSPARDDVLIALAGPASNLLLAVVLTLLLRVVLGLARFRSQGAFDAVVPTLLTFITINISLGLFNLLPIPPLDGSHLVWNLLSLRSPSASRVYFRYGSFLLLGLVLADRMTPLDILPIGRLVGSVLRALLRMVGLA